MYDSSIILFVHLHHWSYPRVHAKATLDFDPKLANANMYYSFFS